jgi:hypothetical protein
MGIIRTIQDVKPAAFQEGKKKEYLKDKINESATSSKNKNRGINKFKKGYQPRNNLVKDENFDLLADSHNILNRWKKYCYQLLNVHRVSDFRHIEIQRVKPSLLEAEIAITKLKEHKSPHSDQIPA